MLPAACVSNAASARIWASTAPPDSSVIMAFSRPSQDTGPTPWPSFPSAVMILLTVDINACTRVTINLWMEVAVLVGVSLVVRRLMYKPSYNSVVLEGSDGVGVHMPPFQTAARHAKVCAFLESDAAGSLDTAKDIWIATFPKCGTTWLQQIVVELLRTDVAEDEMAPAPLPFHLSPWPERTFGTPAGDSSPFRGRDAAALIASEMGPRGARCRPFKTHAPVTLLPGAALSSKSVRSIVITRNPKDACLSMYHHASRIPIFGYDGGFQSDWTKRWSEGNVESGDFWLWTKGWWQRAKDPAHEVLWLHYEDVKRTPLVEVEKVARFLKLDAVAGRSAAQFAALVRRAHASSSFTKMKRQYSTTVFGTGHFRKGDIGDWRNYFSRKESARFDALHAAHFAECPELLAKYYFGPEPTDACASGP